VTEEEVNIELTWTADARTKLATEHQTKLMGFECADDYLRQVIAATIAANEEDTIITRDGRHLSAALSGIYRDGVTRDE